MVRMCLLPELEVLHSVTKSITILLKGHSGISVICKRLSLNVCFFSVAKCTLSDVFPDILVHAFPIILMFY